MSFIPKISIIIPVYNVERTLSKCIDSLLVQTFQDFEVLLIDDGSVDSSVKICDEYEELDDRIRAFHKQNAGVSSARQLGIEQAIGKYTIHVDPDDWVEPLMLEELYKTAEELDSDMLICDFFENSYRGQSYIKQKPTSLVPSIVLEDLFNSIIHGSTCNKLIKRDCYIKYNISFPSMITSCEDQYVIASLLKQNIIIAYLPKAFYHYVRDDSKSSLSLRYSVLIYQEDLIQRDLFNNLLKDTTVARRVNILKNYSIVSKAFFGGKDIYTSYGFYKRFSKYKRFIFLNTSPLVEKILIYFSCIGTYQLMIRLLNIALFFKRKL